MTSGKLKIFRPLLKDYLFPLSLNKVITIPEVEMLMVLLMTLKNKLTNQNRKQINKESVVEQYCRMKDCLKFQNYVEANMSLDKLLEYEPERSEFWFDKAFVQGGCSFHVTRPPVPR